MAMKETAECLDNKDTLFKGGEKKKDKQKSQIQKHPVRKITDQT